jgi:hypothetical protein
MAPSIVVGQDKQNGIDSTARLREIREQLDYSVRDGLSVEEVARIGLDLVGVLDAVIARPETHDQHKDLLFRIGYNQDLRETKSTIASTLITSKGI